MSFLRGMPFGNRWTANLAAENPLKTIIIIKVAIWGICASVQTQYVTGSGPPVNINRYFWKGKRK
jgi:hypothetical protein